MRAAGLPHRRKTPQEQFSPLLLAGVFFAFSPIGVLIGLLQPEPPGFSAATLMCVLSGMLALGWAFAVHHAGRWLLLVPVLLLIPFGFPRLFEILGGLGLVTQSSVADELTTRVVLVVAAVVQISLGFILVIRHVTLTERREAAYQTELNLAERLHRELTPPIDQAGAWGRAAGQSRASNQMGGDLIDLIDHGDHADIVLADVSGHGVRAAMVMAMFKTALRGISDQAATLQDRAATVNTALVRLTASDVFATAWFVRLSAVNRAIMVGCGHPPALILGRDGRLRAIAAESLPLGIDESSSFESLQVTIEPGERLILYSDGLTEAGVTQGRPFGDAGLRKLILATHRRAPPDLPGALLDAIDAYAPPNDDRSILVIQPA